MVLDGEAMADTLMDIVKAPWKANPSNSVVGFNDNSSAIRCGWHGACYPGSGTKDVMDKLFKDWFYGKSLI